MIKSTFKVKPLNQNNMKRLIVVALSVVVTFFIAREFISSEWKESNEFRLLKNQLISHPEKLEKISVAVSESDDMVFKEIGPAEAGILKNYKNLYRIKIRVPFEEYNTKYGHIHTDSMTSLDDSLNLFYFKYYIVISYSGYDNEADTYIEKCNMKRGIYEISYLKHLYQYDPYNVNEDWVIQDMKKARRIIRNI